MISMVIFLVELGALQKICRWQRPGRARTLVLIFLATILLPGVLFAARVAIAAMGIDGNVMTANEHVASAMVQSFLAMLVTPFFVMYFRKVAPTPLDARTKY